MLCLHAAGTRGERALGASAHAGVPLRSGHGEIALLELRLAREMLAFGSDGGGESDRGVAEKSEDSVVSGGGRHIGVGELWHGDHVIGSPLPGPVVKSPSDEGGDQSALSSAESTAEV